MLKQCSAGVSNPFPAQPRHGQTVMSGAPHEPILSCKDVWGVTVNRSQAPLLGSEPLVQLLKHSNDIPPGSPLLPPSFLQNFSTSLQTLGWALTSFSYLMLSFPRKSNLM